MVPMPYYSLINTSKGNDPAVVVVNTALRHFEHRDAFPWHLRLTIECKLVANNGMPTSEEISVLERFEDEISADLQRDENATFLARITCRGEREIIYRVRDPELANDTLHSRLEEPTDTREWDYRMEHDSGWDLAQPELQLIERDPRTI
jgi:hypothetical protein